MVRFRKSFQVPDPAAVQALWLRADCSDGLILYLNGQEVARRSSPAPSRQPVVPPDQVPTARSHQVKRQWGQI